VRLEEWLPGATIEVANPRGLEFFVVSGALKIGSEALGPQSWGRLPPGMALNATVGPQGATIWMKDAPLMHADVRQLPGAA
jgi:hypothetical protein